MKFLRRGEPAREAGGDDVDEAEEDMDDTRVPRPEAKTAELP